jgi:hypothetical protein
MLHLKEANREKDPQVIGLVVTCAKCNRGSTMYIDSLRC